MSKQQQRLIADINRFTAAWRQAPPALQDFVRDLSSSRSQDSYEDLFIGAGKQYGKAFVQQGHALSTLRYRIMQRLHTEIWRGVDDDDTVEIEAIASKTAHGDAFAQWLTGQMQDATSFVYAYRNREVVVPREYARKVRQQ
jgi:hypothetical protein